MIKGFNQQHIDNQEPDEEHGCLGCIHHWVDWDERKYWGCFLDMDIAEAEDGGCSGFEKGEL